MGVTDRTQKDRQGHRPKPILTEGDDRLGPTSVSFATFYSKMTLTRVSLCRIMAGVRQWLALDKYQMPGNLRLNTTARMRMVKGRAVPPITMITGLSLLILEWVAFARVQVYHCTGRDLAMAPECSSLLEAAIILIEHMYIKPPIILGICIHISRVMPQLLYKARNASVCLHILPLNHLNYQLPYDHAPSGSAHGDSRNCAPDKYKLRTK